MTLSLRSTRLASALAACVFAVVAFAPAPASAKLAFFRNYPDLKWKVIKTEHFNVFYPVSKNMEKTAHRVDGELMARKTAYVAEEMYPLVCGQFNYYLDETVNIVMLDQTDDLTGYTIPNFDWIVVSGRHSDMLWRWRGHTDWIRDVMYHEFAHVISLKADQPFAEESFGSVIGAHWNDGRINSSLNAQVFVGSGDPWFWVEGGAEYYTDVAGINHWTSNRDMRIRMDILEDAMLSLDDMSDYEGAHGGFDGERHYQGGYAFALYLEERFGEGVYQSFSARRSEEGWTPDWLSVIEDTLHVSADELYNDFQAWAKAKYEKVRDEVMKEPAIGEQLALSRSYWLSDSPKDQEKKAWLRTRKGADKYEWRRTREKDGGFQNISIRFAPDGSKWGKIEQFRSLKIYYAGEDQYAALSTAARWRDGEDAADKIEPKPITLAGAASPSEGQFDFSPDGRRIVYVCDEDKVVKDKATYEVKLFSRAALDLDGYTWHKLCIVDIGAMEESARSAMIEHFGMDPMAEDAERYQQALRGFTPQDPPEKVGKKWKWRTWQDWVDGDGWKHVVPHIKFASADMRVQDPNWSPDGKSIAFSKYDDLTQNLFVLDLDSGTTRQLTHWDDSTRIEGIDWSPDGTQLVAGLYRWDKQDLYVFDAKTGAGRALTFDSWEDREPTWGHDGNIYFSSDRVGGIFNVFRLDPRLDPAKKDQDLDGVADAADQCAAEPETFNLYKDEDGCPDGVPVKVTKDAIEIGDKIFFELDSDMIKPESFDLLRAVARVMKENPRIKQVEVGGHTDSQGTPEYNLDLSARRAASVVKFFVAEGVDAARLTSQGFGQTLPLVQGDTEDAFAVNRRVEFKILAQDVATEIVEAAPTVAEAQGCGTRPEDRLLANAPLLQLTNVVAGAFTPSLTPTGHIVYEHYTPWGYKDWAIRCDQFLNRVADTSTLVIPEGKARLDVVQEDLPDYVAITEDVPVHAAYVRNPAIIPIFDIGNVSLSHIGVQFGFQFWISDVLDTNELIMVGLAGDDTLIFAAWTNKQFWPELTLSGFFRLLKTDYGFLFDDDGSAETTDDQFLADQKLAYVVYGGGANLTLPFSQLFQVDVSTFHYGLSVQGVDDGKKLAPIWYRGQQSLTARLGSISTDARDTANIRGARLFTLEWSPNYTIPNNSASAGVDVDDGQVFGRYFYNRFDFSWSEYIALPIKDRHKNELGHTLQIDTQVAVIDRNVPYGDEAKGGGSGRLNFTNPLASNTVFAGYEPYSLSGETAALVSLQYRFPLAKDIDKKIGQLYIDGIYMQVFGTVGNFWSYKLKPGARTTNLFGERVLADEDARRGGGLDSATDDVIREAPGMLSTENGNYLLADAGIELRLSAGLFNRSTWNSFLRVAYGFMPISGRGDVNGDDIYTNSADPTLDNRSSERERGGIRFYLGIGTGW